jgi:hypothetical protein
MFPKQAAKLNIGWSRKYDRFETKQNLKALSQQSHSFFFPYVLLH